MLNYFPKIYDYELFYSIYSRLKQDINVQSNQSFKEIVFKRPNEYIEIFYINEPSDVLRSFISKIILLMTYTIAILCFLLVCISKRIG